MLPSFCKDNVFRLRPQMIESRGKSVPDWSQTERRDVCGCSMQPVSTSSSTDGRVNGISEICNLFAPTCADIIVGDRIEYNDPMYGELIYEVVGVVRVQPTACRLDHKQISLRRYDG